MSSQFLTEDSLHSEETSPSVNSSLEERINLWLDEQQIFISDGKAKSTAKSNISLIMIKRNNSELLDKRKMSHLNLKLQLIEKN
jgi:hypothetical protein